MKSIRAPRQPIERQEYELEPLTTEKTFLPGFEKQYEAELEARAMPRSQMPNATILERVVYKALWDRGYRPPDLDFQSSMQGGRLEWGFGRQVADFAIRSLGIIIECQGGYWHQFGEQRQRDIEREVLLRMVPRPVPWLVYFLQEPVIRDRYALELWLDDHVVHAGLRREDRALPGPPAPWYGREELMVTGNLPETGQDWSTRSPINYLVNGGFEADSVYPIGWTVQAGATATIVGGKLRINASSADNGVYQELTGLRPDAIYTVVCQVNTGGNEARIITTGSEHNLDEIVKTVQERQWSGLCRASSTGTLTLYLTAHTTGVNIDFDDVCVFRGHLAFPFVPNSMDSWRHPSDSVLIDGGDIYAHSVTAEKVNVVPGNMLANGGFEAGTLVEWTAGDGSPAVQSGNAHSGSYGAQGTGDGVNNLAVLTQSIKVQPSRNYHLSVWVKNGTGTGQAGCYVVWLDKNGGSVGLSSAHDAASTTWAKKSIVAAAPASAATAEFTLTISSDNSATVYFDDCEFYDTDAELLVGIPGGARVQITSSGIQGYKAGPVQTLNVGTDGTFWLGAASGNESIVYDGSTMSLTNVSLSVTDGTFTLKSGTSGARVELDSNGLRTYDAAAAQKVNLAKDGTFLLKGNDTNYLQWDGTNFTVKGQIYVTGGDAAKTDLTNVTANTVVGKVNTAGATLIAPGRIEIYGGTTLEGWRYGNTTYIDGGDIYAGSITAPQLAIIPYNEAPNPGFEDGDTVPYHWTTTNATWGAYGRAGSKGFRMLGTGAISYGPSALGYAGDQNRYFHAKPDSTYVLSVWLLQLDSITGTAGLYMYFYDSSDTYLSTIFAGGTGSAIGAWTRYQATGRAPSNACYYRLGLRLEASVPSNHRVYFDDVSLREADSVGSVFGVPGGARVEITATGIKAYKAGPTQTVNVATDGTFWFGAASGNESIVFDGSTTTLTNVSLSITDGTFTLKSGTSGARVELDTNGLRTYDAGAQRVNIGKDGKFWFGAASGANSLVFDGSTMALTDVDLSIVDGGFTLKSGTSGARVELDTNGFRIYDAASAQNVKLAKDGKFLFKGNDTNYIEWDGATFTVKGQIYVTGGDAAKTDLTNVLANTVVGKVNSGATLIQPGRVEIYGGATLDGWRYGNTTYIDGGDIYTGTVTASKMTVAMANLVDNPGFEFPGASWDTRGLSTFSTDNPLSGSYELRYDPPSNGEANVASSSFIPVRAGQTYYAEVYCHASGGAGRTMGMRLVALDKTGTLLRRYVSTLVTYATGGYTKRSALVTLDSDVAFLIIELYVGTDCITGTAHYWDDVVLREATGANLLVGTPGSARVEINNSGIEGYSDSTTKQFYLRTSDGRAMFGGGKGVLDKDGLVLDGVSGLTSAGTIKWMGETDPPSGDMVARIGSQTSGFDSYMYIQTNPLIDFSTSTIGITAYGNKNTTYTTLAMRSGASAGSAEAYLVLYESGNLAASIDLEAKTPRIYLATGGTTRLTVNNNGINVAGDYYIDDKPIISGFYSGSLSYKYTSGTWFNLLNTSNLGSVAGHFLIAVGFSSSDNGGAIYDAQLLILATMRHGTNSSEHFTVPMHIGGHALNGKTIQARTQLTAKTDGKTYLQLNINESPTSAVTFAWAAIRLF